MDEYSLNDDDEIHANACLIYKSTISTLIMAHYSLKKDTQAPYYRVSQEYKVAIIENKMLNIHTFAYFLVRPLPQKK